MARLGGAGAARVVDHEDPSQVADLVATIGSDSSCGLRLSLSLNCSEEIDGLGMPWK